MEPRMDADKRRWEIENAFFEFICFDQQFYLLIKSLESIAPLWQIASDTVGWPRWRQPSKTPERSDAILPEMGPFRHGVCRPGCGGVQSGPLGLR